MSDFVLDAAQVLAELAGTGAAIGVQEASKEAGQSAAKKILGKLGGLLKKPEPDVADYEQALRAALDDGTVDENDLKSLVQQAATASSESGSALGSANINGRNVFVQTVHHGPVTLN